MYLYDADADDAASILASLSIKCHHEVLLVLMKGVVKSISRRVLAGSSLMNGRKKKGFSLRRIV